MSTHVTACCIHICFFFFYIQHGNNGKKEENKCLTNGLGLIYISKNVKAVEELHKIASDFFGRAQKEEMNV